MGNVLIPQKTPKHGGNDTMGRIYCGTYEKYNSGSLQGKWLNVEDYDSKEDFLRACGELHDDETDPEFMFQDWENVPSGLISESWISEIVFKSNEIKSRVEVMGVDFSVFVDFCDYYGYTEQDKAIKDFENALVFCGSLRDFVEECEEIPDRLYNYINWDDLVREYSFDYDEICGCVFRNC